MKSNGNCYGYQKLRGLKRKLHLIDLRGGCCEKCGYQENLAALDFHHKDPKEKENQLDMRKLSNSTMDWILLEFEKCDVLCSNCHREVHSPDLKIENVRLVTENNENILKVRKVNKPKCLDCGQDIDYGTKRCKVCYAKSRRIVERPEENILNEEVKNFGYSWTARKYGVSDKTIKKWIRAYIASHS
jgi:transposase-like protein